MHPVCHVTLLKWGLVSLPLAVGNCYTENGARGAALINKVFISHFPWWFSLISPLIVRFHHTRSVLWPCMCVYVCVCFGAVSQRAGASRLLMEAGLETAEGIFVSYIYTVTSTGGGLQLIWVHASLPQLPPDTEQDHRFKQRLNEGSAVVNTSYQISWSIF